MEPISLKTNTHVVRTNVFRLPLVLLRNVPVKFVTKKDAIVLLWDRGEGGAGKFKPFIRLQFLAYFF